MDVVVEVAKEVTADLVEAFARLIPQLSRSASAPSEADLKTIVESPATELLVARASDGAIVGSLTLVDFRIRRVDARGSKMSSSMHQREGEVLRRP